MLSGLVLLISLFTETQQSHVHLICPAAPDPIECSPPRFSNCITDADCFGEHSKCCPRRCNVLRCINFTFEPGVGVTGPPGDPAPAPPPPQNGGPTPLGPCPQYGPLPPGFCSRPGEIYIKDGVKCNRPPIQFPCNRGNPHKPGKCQPVNLAALFCPAELPRKCKTDLSCPGIQKCCRRLCEFVCLNPAPIKKPGDCPFVNLALVDCFPGHLHRQCNDDGSCPGTQKCCRRGCAFICRYPGNPCPPEPVCPTSPASPGQCEPRCNFEYETYNDVRCKIRCRRGPRGPRTRPGHPCPPTGCPLLGPPSKPAPTESEPPAPAPPPPQVDKPGECPYYQPASTTCFFPKNLTQLTPLCGNDGDCPGEKKCCQHCTIACLDPGNPCPPDPVCPPSTVRPGQCEPKCIFRYFTTVNGASCKIECTRGPRGSTPLPGQKCPPTGCPLIGPVEPRRRPIGPPAPAPVPPPSQCPPVCAIFCQFGNVLDENNCPTCECKTEPKVCARCCGPPPCCSFCIDCEIGNPLPNLYCGSSDRVCPKGYYCKTNPQIGRLGVCCKGTRPQKCPADHFQYRNCYGKSIRLCKNDDNCAPNKKCCKQGCFHYCIDPVLYEWYMW